MERGKRGLLLSQKGQRMLMTVTVLVTAVIISQTCWAQDGVAGLNEANTKVRGYFDAGCKLMYAVGAVLGLVGAVKVYTKWNQGDNDTSKVAASWFGSCIFLVIVATVIKSFFAV
jgi:hypothetical protein